MVDSVETVNSDMLEAYKLLLEFQKWTYDTYQRDSQFFLTIEILTFGACARAISGDEAMAVPGIAMASVTIVFGLFLTWVWASRQRREFYMSKSRLERLREMEAELPTPFDYFSEIYPAAREHLADSSRSRLPALFERLKMFPSGFQNISFLKSLVIQQVVLAAWVTLAVILGCRVWLSGVETAGWN